MDEINQNQERMKKVKLRSNTTQYQLQEDLQNHFNEQEFQLSIKFCRQANSFVDLINAQFHSFLHLKTLSIKLDNLVEFDILKLFGNLKLLNLESLSISILKITMIKIESQQTIGECIENLQNLNSLNLKFDCKTFPYQSNILKLESAYKKLQNLRIVQIELVNFKRSHYLIDMVDGLKYQVNLNQLVISYNTMYQMQLQEQKILSEQFRHLTNLKTLKIFKMFSNQLIYQNSQELSIKYLENLENLTLRFSLELQVYQHWIEDLLSLKKLKNVRIELFRIRHFENFKKYLEVISKISINTESINLTCNINHIVDKPILSEISLYLEKIQRINELSISFFQLILSQQDMLTFLRNLQTQKNLYKFYFNYNHRLLEELKDDEANQDIKFNDCFSKLNDLEIRSIESDFPQFWIPIFSSISSLQKITIQNNQSNFKDSIMPLDLKNIILNKQNLEKVILKLNRVYQINQSTIIQFLEQLSFHPTLKEILLDFSRSQSFNDQILQIIKKPLQNLNKLTKLEIKLSQESNFSLSGISQLNKGLSCLQNLESLNLNLKKVALPGRDISVLFESLKNMINLKTLNVNYSISTTEEYDKQQVVEFPISLKNLRIVIQDQDLHYKQISGLIQGLQFLYNLRDLHLNFNVIELNQIDLEEIRTVLCSLNVLQRITLFLNQLNLLQLIQLFNHLQFLAIINLARSSNESQFFQVKLLDIVQNKPKQLSYNQLQQEIQLFFKHNLQMEKSSIKILKELFQIYQLTNLRIDINCNNKLDDTLGCDLFSSFQWLKCLKKLDLSILKDSNIGNNSLNQLGLVLKELTNIIKLFIQIIFDGNNISIPEINQFNDSLEYLINLQEVEIKLSSISCQDLNIIFEKLKNAVNLKRFQIQLQQGFQFEEGCFKFKKDSFQNLNDFAIFYLPYSQQCFFQSEFFFSLRNLQNLKMISILPNYLLKSKLLKIKRLVTIISRYGILRLD